MGTAFVGAVSFHSQLCSNYSNRGAGNVSVDGRNTIRPAGAAEICRKEKLVLLRISNRCGNSLPPGKWHSGWNSRTGALYQADCAARVETHTHGNGFDGSRVAHGTSPLDYPQRRDAPDIPDACPDLCTGYGRASHLGLFRLVQNMALDVPGHCSVSMALGIGGSADGDVAGRSVDNAAQRDTILTLIKRHNNEGNTLDAASDKTFALMAQGAPARPPVPIFCFPAHFAVLGNVVHAARRDSFS